MMNLFQNAASSCLRYSVRKSVGLPLKKQQVENRRTVSTSTETNQSSPPISESTDTRPKKTIVIPKRVERRATDILKALSSTVSVDYTAPHYKYHDDPFLIPTSNLSKRAYALSQESGRKAARWIRQEHAELFQHKVADPPIEAFFPQVVYDEKSEVDEAVLQKVIAQLQVSDALTVYELLEQKGVELSRDTKQSLLELLCYHNCQDTLEEDWIEERWFQQSSKSRERKKNTWKKGSKAEKLFLSFPVPDASSYAALLCGKARAGDIDGAYRLYQEASDAGFILPCDAFNALISGAPILREGHELRWQFVEEMLGVMKQQGVSPNLGTLNAILETLSSMSTNSNSHKYALEVIAEFRAMGIEPSVGSYYFLLKIFCQDRSSVRSAILVSILDILHDKSLTIRDPRDVLFFNEAMDNCRFHIRDIDQAYRLDKLLHTGDNYNLIGDSFKESIYYRNFFALVCQDASFKEFMELYNKLVPNIYVPEPGIMEEVIKALELNEAWDHLPRFWSDIVMFDQAGREATLCLVLTSISRAKTTDTSLSDELASVAWAIWERVENQREDRLNKSISWTGQMLGDIVLVLLRAHSDYYSKVLEIMKCLDKRQEQVLGVPPFECLSAFLVRSIEKKEIKNAIWCVQYSSDAGFEETVKLALKLEESVKLSEADRAQLVNIVGHEALSKETVAASQ